MYVFSAMDLDRPRRKFACCGGRMGRLVSPCLGCLFRCAVLICVDIHDAAPVASDQAHMVDACVLAKVVGGACIESFLHNLGPSWLSVRAVTSNIQGYSISGILFLLGLPSDNVQHELHR